MVLSSSLSLLLSTLLSLFSSSLSSSFRLVVFRQLFWQMPAFSYILFSGRLVLSQQRQPCFSEPPTLIESFVIILRKKWKGVRECIVSSVFQYTFSLIVIVIIVIRISTFDINYPLANTSDPRIWIWILSSTPELSSLEPLFNLLTWLCFLGDGLFNGKIGRASCRERV